MCSFVGDLIAGVYTGLRWFKRPKQPKRVIDVGVKDQGMSVCRSWLLLQSYHGKLCCPNRDFSQGVGQIFSYEEKFFLS